LCCEVLSTRCCRRSLCGHDFRFLFDVLWLCLWASNLWRWS
jgi:hypothetical protein